MDLSDLLDEYFNAFHALSGTIGAKILNERMTGIKEEDAPLIKELIGNLTVSYFAKSKSLSKIKILQMEKAGLSIHQCSIESSQYLECLRRFSKQGIDFPEDKLEVLIIFKLPLLFEIVSISLLSEFVTLSVVTGVSFKERSSAVKVLFSILI